MYKIWFDLHSDMQDLGLRSLVLTKMSEVPCRVSSDVHEKRNELATVLRIHPVNLRWLCRRGLLPPGQEDPVELYCSLVLVCAF